ncbi:MAG: hypothetical protein ACFFD4_37550 [Candidatus Odinarchaeota archaeon]
MDLLNKLRSKRAKKQVTYVKLYELPFPGLITGRPIIDASNRFIGLTRNFVIVLPEWEIKIVLKGLDIETEISASEISKTNGTILLKKNLDHLAELQVTDLSVVRDNIREELKFLTEHGSNLRIFGNGTHSPSSHFSEVAMINLHEHLIPGQLMGRAIHNSSDRKIGIISRVMLRIPDWSIMLSVNGSKEFSFSSDDVSLTDNKFLLNREVEGMTEISKEEIFRIRYKLRLGTTTSQNDRPVRRDSKTEFVTGYDKKYLSMEGGK